jgi:hypothetical protein
MQPNALLVRQNFDSQKVSVTRQPFPPPHHLPSPPSPLQPYKRGHHLGHFPCSVLPHLAPLIRAPSHPTPSIDAVFHSSPPLAHPRHRAARFWPWWALCRRPLPPRVAAVSFGAAWHRSASSGRARCCRSTVDHGAAQSTDPWTRSTEFSIEKYFIFYYILRNLHWDPRVLFKLQHSPQFQILFNIWSLEFTI